MDPNELKNILEQHVIWLADHATGKRADLLGADLRDAKLQNAKLLGADLRHADLWIGNIKVKPL